ncbi:MAG: hypothetical protein KAU28_09800, partial [Phycisphaerae bacterium]|nr:hypothetical protein [Phycisphaerae bacterium]
MKSSGKRLIPVGLSIAVAVLWLATPVFGASITGTNPVLTASGGSLFIPLTPAASGTLATGGPGWSSDSATVSGVGGTSSGFVSFVLSFDLSSELGPGEIVEPITSNLVLTFDDMDFKPDPIGPTLLQEIMALTFLRDATDAPGAVDLVMNNLNYGLYRPDGFGETDNTTVSYLLNMLLDLGLSNADFDDMNADKEFGLYVTF